MWGGGLGFGSTLNSWRLNEWSAPHANYKWFSCGVVYFVCTTENLQSTATETRVLCICMLVWATMCAGTPTLDTKNYQINFPATTTLLDCEAMGKRDDRTEHTGRRTLDVFQNTRPSLSKRVANSTFLPYIPADVIKKISIMSITNTNPTNIWKAPIFFFPMAVPVHGQLQIRIRTQIDMEKMCKQIQISWVQGIWCRVRINIK